MYLVDLDDSKSVGVAAAALPACDDNDRVTGLAKALTLAHVDRLLNSRLDIDEPLIASHETDRLRLVDHEREDTAPQVHLSGGNLVSGHTDDRTAWSVLGNQVGWAMKIRINFKKWIK